MDYDAIFTAYYTQYRNESDIPASSDPEYTIGLRLANEAINHWANYDGTYWKELWTTHQTDGTGGQTVVTSQTAYTCSSSMREAGGAVKLLSGGDTKKRYPIIDVEDVQFKADDAVYAYFTGNPTAGFTLNLNPAPTSDLNGYDIEFDFYKKPTEFSTGTDTTEMANPYFIVHHMLANRFRGSRNWSGYQTAKRDAENALRVMQADNNSGTWADPFKLADRSSGRFGV